MKHISLQVNGGFTILGSTWERLYRWVDGLHHFRGVTLALPPLSMSASRCSISACSSASSAICCRPWIFLRTASMEAKVAMMYVCLCVFLNTHSPCFFSQVSRFPGNGVSTRRRRFVWLQLQNKAIQVKHLILKWHFAHESVWIQSFKYYICSNCTD